jgi:secreted trypsin-like serine protease
MANNYPFQHHFHFLTLLSCLATTVGCGNGGGTSVSPEDSFGVILGTVWEDRDGDGTFGTEEDEPGLVGFTVFADLNNNGIFELDEPAAVTDPNGFFELVLPPGTYTLAVVPFPDYVPTSPGRGDAQSTPVVTAPRRSHQQSSSVARIVGGDVVPNQDFPYMAAVVPRDRDNVFDGFTCGATLIAPTWLVSAAHCFYDPTNNLIRDPDDFYDVVLNRNTLSEDTVGERLPVKRLIMFPQYPADPIFQQELASPLGDLALMELALPSSLPVVDIARPGDESFLAAGQISTILGWGGTLPRLFPPSFDEPEQIFSDQLLTAQVPIISNDACRQTEDLLNQSVRDEMLCAGFVEGGIDTCQGDSGGPLLVTTPRGLIQAGVVSIGTGCAQPNGFGVYTRLSSFADWIDAITTSPISNGYRVELRAGQIFDKAEFGFQRR